MSHTFRFLAQPLADALWQLDREESHHAIKVLRLKAGDEVEVTNGQGLWAKGVLQNASDKEAIVAVAGDNRTEKRPAVPLRLALGALKPSSVDDILPALVELGADEIHIFLQEATAKERLQDKVQERWLRILRGAGKQSKRAWFPSLQAYGSLLDFLKTQASALKEGGLLLDPDATTDLITLSPTAAGFFLIIGGEKGFDAKERQALAEHGIQAVRLGGHVLRATTAAIAATALGSALRSRL